LNVAYVKAQKCRAHRAEVCNSLLGSRSFVARGKVQISKHYGYQRALPIFRG